MADFYVRKDISAVTAFTDTAAQIEFGAEMEVQAVFNEAGAEPIEVSWDGVAVHARLLQTGPSQAMTWDNHKRRKMWVRRTGVGGGAMNIQVLAFTP